MPTSHTSGGSPLCARTRSTLHRSRRSMRAVVGGSTSRGGLYTLSEVSRRCVQAGSRCRWVMSAEGYCSVCSLSHLLSRQMKGKTHFSFYIEWLPGSKLTLWPVLTHFLFFLTWYSSFSPLICPYFDWLHGFVPVSADFSCLTVLAQKTWPQVQS